MMRGILVPEGATQVVLQYRSLLYWAWWYTPGLMALGAILILLAGRSRAHARRWTTRLTRVWETPPPTQIPADREKTPV